MKLFLFSKKTNYIAIGIVASALASSYMPVLAEENACHHCCEQDSGSKNDGTRTSYQRYYQSEILMNAQSSPSYYYPPYQMSLDNPVQIQYYSPDAQSVVAEIHNKTTGKKSSYPMAMKSSHIWAGQVPTVDFEHRQDLEISFKPMDRNGSIISEQVRSATYITLDQPDSYKVTDSNHPNRRVVAFQSQSDTSPVFYLYWPGLYYTKEHPVAARVTSSRSPENSVRKLDPVATKPGWFEYQIPTAWYSPGEVVTVDFTSKDTQSFLQGSDYPLSQNSDFIPEETIRFKTRLI